jgi:hypothetical protein
MTEAISTVAIKRIAHERVEKTHAEKAEQHDSDAKKTRLLFKNSCSEKSIPPYIYYKWI